MFEPGVGLGVGLGVGTVHHVDSWEYQRQVQQWPHMQQQGSVQLCPEDQLQGGGGLVRADTHYLITTPYPTTLHTHTHFFYPTLLL